MYEIEYNGEKIQYILIKAKIKNMYIQIKEGKVIVKIPMKLKEKYAHRFVNKKINWIYKNLKEEKNKPKIEEKFKTKDIERLSEIVKNNIEKYSNQLGVSPKKVRIRNIKYAWGSCSSKQNITINLKLAKKQEELIEYVVLHEMCHLIHMNHSEKFWELVEKYMPQYKQYRKELKSS